MEKTTLLKGEKVYIFDTINADGYYETHVIECFNIKQAREQANDFVGNSRDNSTKKVGHIRLKK